MEVIILDEEDYRLCGCVNGIEGTQITLDGGVMT